MKSFNQNFTSLKDARYSLPVTVMVFHFASGDVYVSDRDMDASGTQVRGLVSSWGTLTNKAGGLFSLALPEISVELANTPVDPFSGYLESNVPEQTEVELFQWFVGLDFADKEPLGRFVIASPVVYSEGMVRLSLVSAFIKRSRMVGKAVGPDDHPDADPDAIGKLENIIYGSVKNVACLPVAAGAATTLVSDISSGQTAGIEVSGAFGESGLPPNGTLQAGSEKISYTGMSGRLLTGVTRGVSGTMATAHKKGSKVFEVRPDFTYLVAGHPVKSIGDVYVGGVRVSSGVTRNPDAGGIATVVFDEKFTLEKSVDLSVDEGSHTHGITGKTISLFGNVGDIGYGKPALYSNVPSGTPDYGEIEAITVKVTVKDQDIYAMSMTIDDNTSKWHAHAYVLLASGDTTTITVPADSISDPNMDWSNNLKLKLDSSERIATVETVEFIVRYKADAEDAPASGVALRGNSAADLVVGGQVTCDVEGHKDDALGTHTGTPGALVENPADVIGHFLVNYLGTPPGETGPSFAAARAGLAQAVPGGYAFSGVINAPVDGLDLIEDLCAQSRLMLRHDGYGAGLVLLNNAPPAVDKAISADMIRKSSLRLARTGKEEVINLLAVHYARDYSKYPDSAGNYTGLVRSSAMYPADGDAASVGLFGPRSPLQPYKFGFVAGAEMASDLRDFFITRFKDVGRRAYFTVFLDNLELEPGDVIELDYSGGAFDLAGARFYVEGTAYRPGGEAGGRPGEIHVQAREI